MNKLPTGLLRACLFSLVHVPLWLCGQTLDWAAACSYPNSKIRGVERAPDGALFVHGSYEPIGSMPNPHYYIAKYDGDGGLLWQYTFQWQVNDMSVSPLGEVVLVGSFQGTVDCDPTSSIEMVHTELIWSSLCARLDGEGHCVRAFTLDGAALARVETAGDGSIFVQGTFSDTLDADPGPDTHPLVSLGARDILVARYAADDSLLWAGALAGEGDVHPSDLSWDGTELIATQFCGGVVDLDPGPEQSPVGSEQGGGSYVARMNGEGDLIGGTCIGIRDYVEATKVRRAPDGGFLLSATIGGGAQPQYPDPTDSTITIQAEAWDGLLVKYDASFAVEWIVQYEGPEWIGIWDMVCTAAGGVITTGWFRESIDLDPGPGLDYHTCEGTSIGSFCAGYCLENGGLDWSVVLTSPEGANEGRALALVDEVQLLFAGSGSEGTDVDPGPGLSDPNTGQTRNGLLVAYTIPSVPCTWTIGPNGIGTVDGEELSGLSVSVDGPSGTLLISTTEASRPQPLRFTVFNAMGQKLAAQNSTADRTSIDLSRCSTGVYVLHIGTPDGRTLRSLQFQRIP